MEHGNIFQSTPPVKAATFAARNLIICGVISIHAAREGGDPIMLFHFNVNNISIHAAREGGDTKGCVVRASANSISIHAAREGGDEYVSDAYKRQGFQSTPPVKAATRSGSPATCSGAFQSTPPVKAATRREL